MGDGHGPGSVHPTPSSSPWRLRLSYRNATIFVCFFNLVTVLLLLQGFLGISNRKFNGNNPDRVQLRYIIEAEEMRRAMEPVELIKRLREIQQEAYTESEVPVERKAVKQTAARDLSNRLTELQALNDAKSKKGLGAARTLTSLIVATKRLVDYPNRKMFFFA